MKNIDLAANAQTAQQKPLVSIHWDYQNIPDPKLANYLLIFAGSLGYVITKNVYNNWELAKKSDKQILETSGWECINESRSRKNAVDFKLVINCSGEASRSLYSHIFIIVTGDSYSEILIEELQKQGKKVIVIARKGSVNEKLKELNIKFLFVDELPELVGEKNQHQIIDTAASHISYNEAIECLLEATKTALTKGKRTVFPIIDNLMRQLFSQYQGVKSIRTYDGKTFSTFTKFVKAVADDGKVRIKNQELFLIEECLLAN